MCLAIPGQIVETCPGPDNWALADIAGVRRKVDLSLVAEDGIAVGDWVVIHVGFALSKISPEAAAGQMRLLEMLGESEAAVDELGESPAGPE